MSYTHFTLFERESLQIFLNQGKSLREIAVFDSGEVVQLGTHESLVSDEKGKYYALWNAQAQYYQK